MPHPDHRLDRLDEDSIDRRCRHGGTLSTRDVDAILTAVGAELRAERTDRGLAQQDVAALWGMSVSVLCRLELARREPSLRYLIELADVLGLRPSQILRTAEDTALRLSPPPWATTPTHHARDAPSPGQVRDALAEVCQDIAHQLGAGGRPVWDAPHSHGPSAG